MGGIRDCRSDNLATHVEIVNVAARTYRRLARPPPAVHPSPFMAYNR
jgi:hypothetical protein